MTPSAITKVLPLIHTLVHKYKVSSFVLIYIPKNPTFSTTNENIITYQLFGEKGNNNNDTFKRDFFQLPLIMCEEM